MSFHEDNYRDQNSEKLARLQDIVDAFNRVGAQPQDIIDLVLAMKAGGFLKAIVIEEN